MRTVYWVLVGVIALDMSCAPRVDPITGVPRPHSSYSVLRGADLTDFRDVYAAVTVLRRGWLSGRTGELRSVAVYIDGTPAAFDALSAIPTGDVLDVVYLSSIEAAQRFGNGNLAGAIVVRTKR
jgi:hypothetical protein